MALLERARELTRAINSLDNTTIIASSSSPSSSSSSSSSTRGQRKLNVLIAASGSVSVVKIPQLAVSLASFDQGSFSVKIVLSKAAFHFWERAKDYNQEAWVAYQRLLGDTAVFLDEDEWVSTSVEKNLKPIFSSSLTLYLIFHDRTCGRGLETPCCTLSSGVGRMCL